MCAKRVGRTRRRTSSATAAGPPDLDLGSTARQLATVETGTGLQHGPLAIVIALAGAGLWTGARAIWRAWTRDPTRDR